MLVLEVHRIEGGGAKVSVSFYNISLLFPPPNWSKNLSLVSHRPSDGTASFCGIQPIGSRLRRKLTKRLGASPYPS